MPALPPTIKAENASNENVPNYGDDRPSDLSQTSMASALQPASSDRDGRPPALSSRQAPIFLPTASDDRHNADIQAVAIGGAHGADHYYYNDVPGSRWRGGLLIVMAVLALAVLAGTFAYRAMFGGYTFPALPPIVIAGAGPNDIVQNNSDTRRSNSSQTSVTSAGSSEKLQPIDIREAPKTEPRVISNIPISSRPSAGPVAPAPAATASALDPALDQHIAPSVPPPASAAPMPALAPPVLTAAPVPPPASAPAPVSASSEPSETGAVAPAAPVPALAPPVLTAAPVPPPASAPAPVSASSEPSETGAVAPAAPTPALAPPVLTAAPVPPPASAPAPVSASSEPSETGAVAPAAPTPALAPPVLTAAPVPPPASAPAPVSASSEPSETGAVAPAAPTPALAPPVLTAAPVPPPASAPAPVSASSEPSETAAVAPAAEPSETAAVPSVAREPRAPSSALAPPVFTAAPPASAPVMVPASSEPKEIQTVMIAPDGRGGTNTSSPPALAPHSATRAAVRQNAAAASPVGKHDAQKDAAPSPSSRSRMWAGRGTAVEASSGGAYAVQLTSERSAAEAHASFRALRAKFPNQLGGREPIVRRTDLGAKGIYYRTMVGSFASMEKAAGMCRTLKAAGGNCRVQRN